MRAAIIQVWIGPENAALVQATEAVMKIFFAQYENTMEIKDKVQMEY